MLKRPLYRGEILWGRAKKRDSDWQVRARKRPTSEWLRVPAPHLRIVPEDVAEAVDARFASERTRSLRLRDGRLLGRPPGEGSPYLLTGLLTCGVCGGGMEVLSSASGGRRHYHYRCYTARRKGPACCTNVLPVPMGDADGAVLRAVEDTLLDPRVVKQAIAHAEAEILRDRSTGQREALEAELADLGAAMRRLTAAIAKGGDLAPLVAALETHEGQRKAVEARLAALRERPATTLNPVAVRRTLETYLADWQGLLRGHVRQAQQVLRRLVKGRLTMTPHVHTVSGKRRGYYSFSGVGTVRPLLGGTVRMVASPTGTAIMWYRPLDGLIPRVA